MSEQQSRDRLPEAAREERDGEHRRRAPEDPLAALTAFEGETPDIPLEALDLDALKVVQRLRSYGHQAYLVGGCVRDLRLGIRPKDFDVATSAHPGEIRAIFRNCRLIGRRFRLAHVYFKGGKVVETATFRANPNLDLAPEQLGNGDLLITRDNVFGTAEEDARRRDFTINGLFYDVVLGRIIDYVGGLEDLALRRIRTIGDPDVRMREDPVRLLRAIRFAAKLDLAIEPRTWEAMARNQAELARCAPPRVLEELFRLLRSGYSRRCFELLRELGALDVLLPPLAAWLERASETDAAALFTSLGLLDEVVREGPVPDDAVLLSALLIHHSQRQLVRHEPEPAEAPAEDASELDEIEAIERQSDEEAPLPAEPQEGEPVQVEWRISANAESVEELLAELVRSARLPRRIAERARLVLHAQRVLSGVRKRRSSPMKFVRQSFFPDALLVFELYVRATGHGTDALERWRARYAQLVEETRAHGVALPDAAAEILAAEVEAAPPARPAEAEGEVGARRRRRRGGKRRREAEEPAPATEAAEAEPEARLESLPPEAERRPPSGPAELFPF